MSVLDIAPKSIERRRALVAAVNGAEANLTTGCSSRPGPTPAGVRSKSWLEAAAAIGAALHERAQRVKSELGTARVMHRQRLAERAGAVQSLRNALPELPAPEGAYAAAVESQRVRADLLGPSSEPGETEAAS